MINFHALFIFAKILFVHLVVEVISDADLRSFGLVYLPFVEVSLVDEVEFFG